MEMNDIASQQQEEESQPRSSIVSFPDRYLIPYIEWCKRSRRITCSCSLMFIGLAIFCFFATNYMITESNKIAFVFAGVICIVATVSCLNLRFKILNQCKNEPSNNTLFEIAPLDDNAFVDSFSGHFEMESPVGHGTPKEEPSQSETLNDLSTVPHSDNESFRTHFTAFRYNNGGRLPRHSISKSQSPAIPLLPLRSEELSRPSGTQNSMESSRSQIGVTVPGCNKYTPNYSTFETSQLVLLESKFEDGWEASETEPLLPESSYEATETELSAKPSFENDCDVSVMQPHLAETSSENGCKVSETEPLLVDLSNENGKISATKPIQAESTFENDCDVSETKKHIF